MGLVWTRRTHSHDPSSTCRTQIKTEAAIGAQAERRHGEEAAALHHFELHCYIVGSPRAAQHQRTAGDGNVLIWRRFRRKAAFSRDLK